MTKNMFLWIFRKTRTAQNRGKIYHFQRSLFSRNILSRERKLVLNVIRGLKCLFRDSSSRKRNVKQGCLYARIWVEFKFNEMHNSVIFPEVTSSDLRLYRLYFAVICCCCWSARVGPYQDSGFLTATICQSNFSDQYLLLIRTQIKQPHGQEITQKESIWSLCDWRQSIAISSHLGVSKFQ